MKKNRFLKGMSAAFALALVALATTFTSCEKENFNVEVTLSNATASISPVVLYVDATGNVTDVTSLASITPSVSSMVYTGSPALAAQTVEVTAAYNNVSATITVSIPALSAGQNVYLTPTIILVAAAEEGEPTYTYSITQEQETEETGTSVNVDNGTNYYWTTYRTYTAKQGVTAAEVSDEDENYLTNVANSIVSTYTELTQRIDFNVYANSRTTVTITYNKANITLTVKKTADGTTAEEVVGTVTCTNYISTNVNVEENLIIPGHSHSPAGHGHGHGDDPNAGGGIVVSD